METNIKLKEIKINSSIKKYELKTTLLGYANKGLPGKDGINGENGVTFTPSVDNEGNLSWTNNGNLDNPETKNIKGPKGDKGDAGPKGDTGEGVPSGGATGQVLKKKSNTDYDTEWVNESGGGSSLNNVLDGNAIGSARTIGANDSEGLPLGQYAWAEGQFTTAYGKWSHAEGYNSGAQGNYSHAEGYSVSASGNYSHAEGSITTASGNYSHAEGLGTTASSNHSHAQGKYNISDTNNEYAHIVGNGNSSIDTSNAHTIDWQGNAWFSGDVYIGSTSGKNKDDGSKKLATEDMVNTSLSNKQNTLVSGTNIKTINNESILGAGNLAIAGGADIPIGPTPPENPEEGDFWIDTSANGETYGDTLPIGAMVEYNGTTVPQGYEKVSDGSFLDIYSTSEQIIGKDENGKNVYKRTFNGTTSDTSNSTTVTTDYSGKTIVVKKAYGSIYNLSLGGGVNIGGYVNENFYSGLYLHESELQIYHGNSCKNNSYTLTIEFTKISD